MIKNDPISAKKRKEIFACEYLKDLNGSRAAIKAGYSKKTAGQAASRLLKDVKVREIIEQMQSKIERKNIATAQEVEEFLSAAMRGELIEEKSYINAKQKKEKKIAMKERIKAAELLAKRYALLTDKTELSGKDGSPIVIEFAHMRRNNDSEDTE